MMKMSKNICLLVFLLIACVRINTAEAQDPKYLGEFCSTLTSIQGIGFPVQTIRVGALSYGAGHIALDGQVSSDGSQPLPIHGSAVLLGNGISATLTTSGPISQRTTYSKTYYLQGDLATFGGSYISIEFYDLEIGGPVPGPLTATDNGGITRIACP